ncbi:MAG: GDP-mannose 4,6-dehydratase [Desulfocucumaceae bacterium]
MGKTALVTGVTGQDGAYLAEFLLSKGYRVFGAYRRSSTYNFWRLEYLGIKEKVELVPFDLQDMGSIARVIGETRPDEVYNLAAQSFVAVSFSQPLVTAAITGMGPVNILEAIRLVKPDIKMYQASSSEMFGKVRETPQSEGTPFYPRSPYAVAKLYAHWAVVNYRESYGMHCCSGILFNHESPLRGVEFVTRKITDAVARIKHGLQGSLTLGNIDSKRDWGYAPEYVEAMWLMLQRETPQDYVIATGETHSVREFIEEAFSLAGLDWKKYVVTDSALIRPAEVDLLMGDASLAAGELGWRPKTPFKELVRIMLEADMRRAAPGAP